MAKSGIYLATVCLHIFDKPLYYDPPRGPSFLWNVEYRNVDSYQPSNFAYSNQGPKWTFKWLSYVSDDPTNLSANVYIYLINGGVCNYYGFNAATQSFLPELESDDVLVRISSTCYELRHPDGSKDVYERPDGSTVAGRRVFLTKRVDAAGNALTLAYDANLRVTAIQDAIGQVTTISYEEPDDIFKVTKVTDPFGRSTSFSYDSLGRLSSITDMIGLVSSFNYDAGDFITKMTTPYGETKFIKKDGPGYFRSIETQYPLGEKERVEYKDYGDGISGQEAKVPDSMNVTNNFLQYRNTFFWDKKAMADAPGDYTKARLYHWLHNDLISGGGIASPMLESIKMPLENRVWYNYQGQTDSRAANQGMSAKPSIVGRVMDNDSTQLFRYTYNELGAVTSATDPLGRQTTYVYDSNKIDLLEVRQTSNGINDLLRKYTYNSQHLPLTDTDASGQTTYFTYNPAGQLLTVTNPRNEKTTYTYDVNGYLEKIVGALPGATTSFTYDGFGRLHSITGLDSLTISKDYDGLNRPTLISYPDSTFEQIVYDRLDDVHHKDRIGRWSHTIYDSLDRPTVMIDPLGRITQYLWCACGQLAAIVDPLKHVTSWERDVQGRTISKTYDDGKGMSYKYEATTSRLTQATDAKGQNTNYSYYLDNDLKKIDYTNAVIATPSVSYTYDVNYNRISSMLDGTGVTTYTYNPVNSQLGSNKLATIDGPLANDLIGYSYDSLGRITDQSINGITSSMIYDPLGRVTSETNALGTFGYNYLDQTLRISSVSYPNGQSVVYNYFNNEGMQRLKEILNKASGGAVLSKFDYEYNNEGLRTKWTQQIGTAASRYFELGYDLSNQLISATQKNQNTDTVLKRYAYQYDEAGNRTSEQIDNNVTSGIYNGLNQEIQQNIGGPMLIKGSLSEFSSVKVKNKTSSDSSNAMVDSLSFQSFVKVVPGNNNIFVTATDYSGNNNAQTNHYNISVPNGANNSLSFDNNGNTLSLVNPAITYDWDAADRLVKITRNGNVTEFIYDGLSRRVAEKLNGSITRRWVWCGNELCEERDAAGSTVTKRFFKQGEQISGANYYFTRDHLGSIREMVASNGTTIKARYDYDPFGRRSNNLINNNPAEADFGFTGHYFHQASGLYLALYRAYDANLGRWLSRDPYKKSVAKRALYVYCKNEPINSRDSYGLSEDDIPWSVNPPNDPTPANNHYNWELGPPKDPNDNTYSPTPNNNSCSQYHTDEEDCETGSAHCAAMGIVSCAAYCGVIGLVGSPAASYVCGVVCSVFFIYTCLDYSKSCQKKNKAQGY
jgi:RHS repeat-associated protein